MEALVGYLPFIACGAMMLLICIPMMRSMHKDHGGGADKPSRDEMAELREEVARLKAEKASSDTRETIDG
jgi:hypothetical protein